MWSNDLRTTAADGTTLAYHVEGDGPALVFVNGFTTSNFFWHAIVDRFGDRAAMITWDYKGHGSSGPASGPEGTRMDVMIDDLSRVMDAAGVRRGVLIGFSMGCQVILEAWRHIPDRIAGLAPVLGPYGHMLDTALSPLVGRAIHEVMQHTGARGFGAALGLTHAVMSIPGVLRLGRLLKIAGPQADPADLMLYIDHFAVVDPETVRLIGVHAQQHTARDVLPTIAVPTLIVTGDEDIFAPSYLALEMHQLIPDSTLLRLPGGTHTSLFEHPDIIGAALDVWLVEIGWLTPAASPSGLGAGTLHVGET